MAKKATITDVSTGYQSNTTMNDNFEALNDAFDNTLSLDGSTPNAMGADLDMNANDVLNAGVVNSGRLVLGGTEVSASDLANAAFIYAKEYGTVANMLDDTQVFTAGQYLHVIEGDFSYKVVLSSGHVSNAGGVELDVLPGDTGSVTPRQWATVAPGLAADATAMIQNALDNFSTTTIQNRYRIDGTLKPNTGSPLVLSGEGRLTRTTDTANTDPVVWLDSTKSAVRGDGSFLSIIETQNAAPKGVVQIGPNSISTPNTNVQGCSLSGLFIEGSTVGGQTAGTPDSAVFLTCGDGISSTNYYHEMDGIRVSQANIGLRLQGNSNMNRLSNWYAQNLGNASVASAMLYIEGAVDNVFANWTFSGSSGTTFIKMEDHGGLRPSANVGSGMVCEQGGGGLFIDADVGFTGTNNNFQGSGNTVAALNIGSNFYQFANQLSLNGLSGNANLRFPGTAVPISDPNTLDDYEEAMSGGWTPVIDSETAGNGRVTTVDSATYLKVGRSVSFSCVASLATKGTGGSGNLVLRGLPFTSLSDGNQYQAPTVVLWSNLSVGLVCMIGYVKAGTTFIRFHGATGASTSPGILDFATYATTGTKLILNGVYYASQ